MHSIASSIECEHILGSKPQVMLKFSAEWCGPCKAVSPIIEKMAPQFPDVFMAEIDIDKSQDLASMYNVSAVPSFVFFHNKTEVDRVKGADIAKVTASLRALAAKTPSFGKGHRVGSHPIEGAATTMAASKPPPTTAEIRAARTRALESKASLNTTTKKATGVKTQTKTGTDTDTESILTRADKLAASKNTEPAHDESSPGFLRDLVYYLVLYFSTLLCFDVRSKVAELRRKRE